MKMYRDEKIQGLHKMILFVKIFANIKRCFFISIHFHTVGFISTFSKNSQKVLSVDGRAQ